MLDNDLPMKRMLLFIGLLIAIPSTVHAGIAEDCKAKYPLPEREINFVEERTGHDPRQFLIRRCITKERKRMVNERRMERDQVRKAAHFDKSAAQAQKLRMKTEHYIQDAIRRQLVKTRRFRSRTNVLDAKLFREARSSRRSIIRQAEGHDHINAIRRSLRSRNLADPCLTVGAIRYNNPCKDYGHARY